MKKSQAPKEKSKTSQSKKPQNKRRVAPGKKTVSAATPKKKRTKHDSNRPAAGARVRIVDYTVNEYYEAVKAFHGMPAPGLILGGFMVHKGLRALPEGVLYEAISETYNCLPDAIQLLTPCTIGNGWLHVHPLGRFALAFYDKYTRFGVRVFPDVRKLETWPEIKKWLFKSVPKKEQDLDQLNQEIITAGEAILAIQKVQVRPGLFDKKHKQSVAVCPECGEVYPGEDGSLCKACDGQSPYF